MPIIAELQQQRKLVTDEILAEFMRPRPLKWGAQKRRPAAGEQVLTKGQTSALNAYLAGRSYLVGFALSEADVSVRARLDSSSGHPHIARWMKHVDELVVDAKPAKVSADVMADLKSELGQMLFTSVGFSVALLE